MLKREDKDIDDLKFTVVQFPAMYAFGLLARLLKTIGPVMATLGNNMNVELSELSGPLREALSALDPEEAQKLVLEILKSTSVIIPDPTGGRKVEFTSSTKIDEVFSGRLMTMFKVVVFAAQVNFADFVQGIGSKLASTGPTATQAPSA